MKLRRPPTEHPHVDDAEDSAGPLRRRIRRIFGYDVWVPELETLTWGRRLLYRTARVGYLTYRGFEEDACLFRASALTYITLLSLVPLLAFAFSVAKGFGAYNALRERTIDPFLDQIIGPSAAEGAPAIRTAVDRILEFVDHTDVSNLGILGLLALMYAVIRLLGTVENSFNDIWGVRRSRSWFRRVSDYLTLVLVTPILLVLATAVTTAAQSAPFVAMLQERLHLDLAIDLMVRFTPHLSIIAGLTLMYLILPNARTRVASAILGGLVSGTVWQLAQVGHLKFQIGVARYNAIYSSFAALPLFLFWIYVSWAIVLFGAELAAAHQSERAFRQIVLSRPPDHAFRQIVALRAVTRIARSFLNGHAPTAASKLADTLGLPVRLVNQALGDLVGHGLLARTSGNAEETYVLSRDPGQVRIKDVLDALKGRTGPVDIPSTEPIDTELARILGDLEEEIADSPANRTLRELAELAGAAPEPSPEATPEATT